MNTLLFLTLRDTVEILFFATLIYYFSLWLKQDRHKKLLPYFYTYCTLIFIAHHAQLTTISHLFYTSSAFFCIFLILIHQHTLQKNFVTLRALQLPHATQSDWLETLTQSALIALNHHKSFSCIIEQQDTLATILQTAHPIHADIEKTILEIIVQSTLYDNTRMLWTTAQGKLKGINAQWAYNRHEHILIPDTHDQALWLQEALFFTTKSDALIFITAPATRSVTLIMQGHMRDKLPMHEALPIMKKYLAQSQTSLSKATVIKKDMTHAHTHTSTSTISQRSS